MYTEKKTERTERYEKLSKNGFWARGRMHRQVMYVKEEGDIFTAYTFNIIDRNDVDKSSSVKKYLITNNDNAISCSKITCNKNEAIIKENPNYEEEINWGEDTCEIYIEVPCNTKKTLEFFEVPENIKRDMEQNLTKLPHIGIGIDTKRTEQK